MFERTTQAYGKTVGLCLRQSVFVLLVYVALIGLTGFGFARVPSGFVPIQDKGYLVVNIQLPDSASLDRTVEVTEAVEKIALDTPGVAHTVAVPGLSFVLNANSSNYGNMFVILKPFHERQGTALSGEAITGRLRARLQREVPEARVLAFGPPAVRGLGNAGGFKLMVEATGEPNFDALQARGPAGRQGEPATRLGRPVQRLPRPDASALRGHRPDQSPDDGGGDHRRLRCAAGIPRQLLRQRLQSLRPHLAGERPGRRPFRKDAETVKQLKVRNADGDMVPLGAVVDVRESAGPVTITRYNMFPAATITGSWQPGVSTGDVLRTMEALSAQELPRSMAYEWTELSYLQKQASKIEQFRDLRQNPFSAFVLGAVLVFFVLAGLYESWSTPLAVILVVPMCLLSALAGIAFRGMDVNIFVQVGFVVLVGLACKNAILIVEFAKQQRESGKSRADAVVSAAVTRLRPILMTSACFIHMVPPYLAAGAVPRCAGRWALPSSGAPSG